MLGSCALAASVLAGAHGLAASPVGALAADGPVAGFGVLVPLGQAARSIAPQALPLDIAPELIDRPVSWHGGPSWIATLRSAAAAAGAEISIDPACCVRIAPAMPGQRSADEGHEVGGGGAAAAGPTTPAGRQPVTAAPSVAVSSWDFSPAGTPDLRDAMAMLAGANGYTLVWAASGRHPIVQERRYDGDLISALRAMVADIQAGRLVDPRSPAVAIAVGPGRRVRVSDPEARAGVQDRGG